MGDYSRLQIRFAESDLGTAERTFMERLWHEYFGPAQALWVEADGYSRSIELQQQVHARLGLPGTARPYSADPLIPAQMGVLDTGELVRTIRFGRRRRVSW